MYYLNDKHSEYEYVVYKRVGSARPYLARTFDSFDDVLRNVQEIEKRHNHYRQVFYIDNDFYENQYNQNLNGTYYKFLRRPVFDWEEFDNNEEYKFAKILKFSKIN
jgi:hypothetical protein